MRRHVAIPKEVVVHVGFHLFWALLAVASLGGAFMLIPLIGVYETFVLGAVFQAMPESRAGAYGMGLMVFVATGLASAIVGKLWRKRTTWLAGVLSLLPTVAVLTIISLAVLPRSVARRQPQVGASLATGLSGIPEFDELGVWIKAASYVPRHPPSVPNAAGVVRLEAALPLLSSATTVRAPKVSGWYLNLDQECWSALRGRATSPVLIAWSDLTDEQCSVVQIDLKTDVVGTGLMRRIEFERVYRVQRRVIEEVCPAVQLPDTAPTR